MKILAFADLHLDRRSDSCAGKKEWIAGAVAAHKPDVVAVAGDFIVEPLSDDPMLFFNPYQLASKIFKGAPVVFCLGNHEFIGSSVSKVLSIYKRLYNPEAYDAHCLDAIGSYAIGDTLFVGNVLWYDGSLTGRDPKEWVWDEPDRRLAWSDRLIHGFNPAKEHRRCVKHIAAGHGKEAKTRILLTHCVPHRDLNAWGSDTMPSTFSGVADLLSVFKFDYSICGHTHRPVKKMICGCECVNVGNDYKPEYKCEVLEI